MPRPPPPPSARLLVKAPSGGGAHAYCLLPQLGHTLKQSGGLVFVVYQRFNLNGAPRVCVFANLAADPPGAARLAAGAHGGRRRSLATRPQRAPGRRNLSTCLINGGAGGGKAPGSAQRRPPPPGSRSFVARSTGASASPRRDLAPSPPGEGPGAPPSLPHGPPRLLEAAGLRPGGAQIPLGNRVG